MRWLVRKLIVLSFVIVVGIIVVMNAVCTKEQYIAIVLGLYFLRMMIRFTKKQRLLHSSLRRIDHMDGVQFEEYLMYQFKKKGYRVQMTPISGDFGADLILKRRRKKYVVQAKRYSGSVGIKAVQEIIGAQQYYDIDNGMVVTNSYYTKAAKELAEASDIILWDRNDIINEFSITY